MIKVSFVYLLVYLLENGFIAVVVEFLKMKCNENLLSSSDVNVMETTTKSKGQSNLRYNHSNGTLHIPLDSRLGVRHNSVPNGKLSFELKENLGNGNAAYDRMCSVASTNAEKNSVLEFNTETKNKSKFRSCIRNKKCAFRTLFLLALCCIATMTSLYVMEVKRTTQLRRLLGQKKPEIQRTCFARATPMKISNITKEPEIAAAIFKSTVAMNQLVKTKQYHATSITVYYMDELIWSYNNGYMNFKNKESKSPDINTPYPVASVSKMFTVMMLQKFMHDGIIESLDDTIHTYEPNFSVRNTFNNNNITFRQLSSMMSGLPREAPCVPYKKKPHMNMCPHSTSKMLERIKNVSLIQPPGKRPSYSNMGIALLGRILERRTNQTLEEWIEKNILRPLGMENTGFDIMNRKKQFPKSTENANDDAQLVDWGWLNPSGGMYSSAHDLGKLGSLFLHNSKSSIFPEYLLDEMLKPVYIWPDASGQAYPFEIRSDHPDNTKQIGYMTYTKDGSIFGYGALFSLTPELNLNINTFVADETGNAFNAWSNTQSHFLNGLDALLKRKRPKYILPSNANRFVGSYKKVGYWPLISKPVNITLKDKILYLHMEWLTVPLIQTDKYILQSDAFDKFQGPCIFTASGLLKEKYYFSPPLREDGKCPSFHINGVSSFGYLQFVRIKTR